MTAARNSGVEVRPSIRDWREAACLQSTTGGCKPAAVPVCSQNPRTGNHGWSFALSGTPNSCSVVGEHTHVRQTHCIHHWTGHSCSVAGEHTHGRQTYGIHRWTGHSCSAAGEHTHVRQTYCIQHWAGHSCSVAGEQIPVRCSAACELTRVRNWRYIHRWSCHSCSLLRRTLPVPKQRVAHREGSPNRPLWCSANNSPSYGTARPGLTSSDPRPASPRACG